MKPKWMSYPEIAAALHISVEEARKIADRMQCPKVFKRRGELVLIAVEE